MKLHLFQELLTLNEEFDYVIRAPESMEKVPTYRSEMIRSARAHVESAQVETNRQFFAEFDANVENDALAASFPIGISTTRSATKRSRPRNKSALRRGLMARSWIKPIAQFIFRQQNWARAADFRGQVS